jgi:hypothetical protein
MYGVGCVGGSSGAGCSNHNQSESVFYIAVCCSRAVCGNEYVGMRICFILCSILLIAFYCSTAVYEYM